MRIGLPKGSVMHRSVAIIEGMTGRKISPKQLRIEWGEHELFLLKHRDIPVLIENGKLDFGVTSSEWLSERESQLRVLTELDWCNTRISLIGSRDGTKPTEGMRGTCVTEFPVISARELPRLGLGGLTLFSVSGSSEALVPNLFNFGVDCVETGQTLSENNLVEICTLFESRVVVVCRDEDNKAGSKMLDLIHSSDAIQTQLAI